MWDIFHKQLDMVWNKHRNVDLTIRWTPGHAGIEGNKAADEEAKRALQIGSSPHNELPTPLRHTMPHSKSAV
jgi:ribonuclease HI